MHDRTQPPLQLVFVVGHSDRSLTPQGELAMFTRRLDLNGLLEEVRAEPPATGAPRVGSGPEDL